MPDFEFTSPEGKKYTVTGPEGATKEQAWNILQQQLSQPQTDPHETPGLKGYLGSAARGALGTVSRYLSAPGQAEESVMTGGASSTVPSAQKVFEKAGGEDLPKAPGLGGRLAEGIAGSAVDPLSWVGLGGAGAKALGIAGSVGGSELARYLAPDSKIAPILGGMVGGQASALAGVPGRLARIATPNPMSVTHPDRWAAYQRMQQQQGITPRAGDVLGKRSTREWERLGDYPGGGGSYERGKIIPEEQMTARGMGLMGEMGNRVTDQVVQNSEARIGRMFEQAERRFGVHFDTQLGNDLNRIEQEATRYLGGQRATPVIALAQDLNPVSPHPRWSMPQNSNMPRMSGGEYATFTNYSSPLARTIRDTDSSVGHYALQIREALDQAMVR